MGCHWSKERGSVLGPDSGMSLLSVSVPCGRSKKSRVHDASNDVMSPSKKRQAGTVSLDLLRPRMYSEAIFWQGSPIGIRRRPSPHRVCAGKNRETPLSPALQRTACNPLARARVQARRCTQRSHMSSQRRRRAPHVLLRVRGGLRGCAPRRASARFRGGQ